MVLRFLGTSPDSSSVIPLLTSLCRQIAVNYDEPAEEIPGELSPLIQHLRRLLSCATAVKPLFIFLDSLDQLSAADGAHRLSWLPCVLPPHVRLVVRRGSTACLGKFSSSARCHYHCSYDTVFTSTYN